MRELRGFDKGFLKELEMGKFEEDTFDRDASFIEAHYPGDAEKIIREALDGFEVVYVKKGEDVIGLASYDIATDNHNDTYMLFGVSVIDPDYAGRGIGNKLFKKRLEIAENAGASYITAIADTKHGREYLERHGFYVTTDEINGREYYRYDI